MTFKPVSPLSYATPRVQGRSPRARWWMGVLRRAVWCILGLIALGILIGVVSMGSSLLMYWTAPIIILLVLITSYCAQRVRRRRAAVVVSYLDQAVRGNYPLPPWLIAAAESERGAIRRRLIRLVDALRGGVSVADALELTVPEVTRRQIAIVSAAEGAGRLQDGLRRLVRDERRKPLEDIATRGMAVTYPLVITLFLIGVMAFWMIFIIPMYESILTDFNLQIPWASVVMLKMMRVLGMPLGVIAGVMFILVIGRAFEGMFLVIPDLAPPWRRFTDRLAWFVPIWRTRVRSRQLADLCDATATGLDNGLPFDQALREASCVATNRVLNERVRQWETLLAAGQDIHESARQAAMPALMVGMLATATQATHAADVLRFLARYYETRFSRMRAILQGAVIPTVVLIAGAFVLLAVLGMLMPLIDMVDLLSITPQP